MEEGVCAIWSEHSERATMRTWAEGAGIPEAVRKQMGRWTPTTDREKFPFKHPEGSVFHCQLHEEEHRVGGSLRRGADHVGGDGAHGKTGARRWGRADPGAEAVQLRRTCKAEETQAFGA